jgi:GNAT superfamily N-acetyltransferase
MVPPDQTELFDALDATWAPMALHNHAGWIIREGAGGGQRVSAATHLPNAQDAKVSDAVNKMTSLGQTPLFMIRSFDVGLDAELQALGYGVVDPVAILIAPTETLHDRRPLQTHHINRLEAPGTKAINIWAAGGVDQNRVNIMDRVKGSKTILSVDRMGVAFAAAYNDIAMVHAVEVASKHRRKGVANALMYAACQWAHDQNCNWVAVLTVRDNMPAKTLYENLRMTEAAAYHYRIRPSK